MKIRTVCCLSIVASGLVLLGATSASALSGLGGQATATIKLGPTAYRGTWWIQFIPTAKPTVGKYRLTRRTLDGTVFNSGTTTIKPGSIVAFKDVAGVKRCKGTQAVGTYRLRYYSGNRMRLTVVSDSCVSRRSILGRPVFTFYGAAG